MKQRWVLGVAVILCGAAGYSSATFSAALFSDARLVATNTFTSASLTVPGGVSATASCDGLNKGKITVSWSSVSSADGYDIARSSTTGGPYTFLAHTTGQGATTYADRNLPTNTTRYYVVRSTRGSAWTSAYAAQKSAKTPAVCAS